MCRIFHNLGVTSPCPLIPYPLLKVCICISIISSILSLIEGGETTELEELLNFLLLKGTSLLGEGSNPC